MKHILLYITGYSAAGSASLLGSEGRQFESDYPDIYSLVAQLAEQLAVNQRVFGSNPDEGAKSTVVERLSFLRQLHICEMTMKFSEISTCIPYNACSKSENEVCKVS